MIPDDIKYIVMTKKDYDRNVEKLLLDKLELEEKIDKAIEYINKNMIMYDNIESERDDLLEILGDKENE